MIQDVWAHTLTFVPFPSLFTAATALLGVSTAARSAAIKTLLSMFEPRLSFRLRAQHRPLTPEWLTSDLVPRLSLAERMAALNLAVSRRDLALVRLLSCKCARSPLWQKLLLSVSEPAMANALVHGFSRYSHAAAMSAFYARNFDNKQMASIAKGLLTRQQCKLVESALVVGDLPMEDPKTAREWLLLSNRPGALENIIRHFGHDGLQRDLRRCKCSRIIWEYVAAGLPLDEEPGIIIFYMMHATLEQRLGAMETYAHSHRVVVRMMEFVECVPPRCHPYLERLCKRVPMDEVRKICKLFLQVCIYPELLEESMVALDIHL